MHVDGTRAGDDIVAVTVFQPGSQGSLYSTVQAVKDGGCPKGPMGGV